MKREPHAIDPFVDPATDLLADESLARAWARRFREIPDRKVLCDVATGRWLTYGELAARSADVASRFSGVGLCQGDRILFSARSSVDFVVAYVAAVRLGLVVVPVDPALTPREVHHVLADATPRAAVVDDVSRSLVTGLVEFVCGPEVDAARGPEPSLDLTTREDLAMIAYTSGTTGEPKGAMLESGNLLASAAALALAWRWSIDDRLVHALPLFHMHGLGVGLNGTLTAGASLVLVPKFDPDAVFDAVAEHDATLFFGVPTMYQRLASSPRLSELSALRLCVSGSAPLPVVLHRAIAAGGHQQVLERYGMTETAMNTSNPYDAERRAGTVGWPLPGVELRLAEDDEIQLKGPHVFRGYWQRPEATASAFTDDGWFRSGDLGAFDEDGYLSIVGRTKDLIITGGHNVYPREVEEVLLGHPNISEVAVAGIPSEEWGEVVGAWVVTGGELDLEEFHAFAAARLARYKRPRVICAVEELPRNAMGKVVKRELPDPGA